jgi:hypothetical protein
MELFGNVGSDIVKTTNIKTDCGYVHLYHNDIDQLNRDYHILCETIQPYIFEIETKTEIDEK